MIEQIISQIIIAICGIATVYLSQDARPHVRRWACIVGLFAQPAWLYSSVHAEQWGIALLTFVYLAGWYRGVWNFWILKRPA